jgi:hypothetical protein
MQPIISRHSRRCGAVTIRMMGFLAVVSCPIVWLSYIYVSEKLNGGIERHADYTAVELKPMGDFRFDDRNGTDADIPSKYRALDGKRAMLEGFMNPLHSAGDETREFEFVYNVQICCFGAPPQVQERVYVHVPNNGSVPVYLNTFLQVIGVLHVHVVKDAGEVQSVYTLDLEQMRPVE